MDPQLWRPEPWPEETLVRLGSFHACTPETLAKVPTRPGLYVALLENLEIADHLGLRWEVGLPLVVYVGKAARERGGLRSRLREHFATPWQAIGELLACNGRVLPDLWSRAEKITWTAKRSRPVAPPMAELAIKRTLAWQNEHLIWGWLTDDDGAGISSRESSLIEELRPLINLRGRGEFAQKPPQLRYCTGFERSRARWLWLHSWTAVLDVTGGGDISAWRRRPNRFSAAFEVAADELGYPAPLDAGKVQRFKRPSDLAWADALVEASSGVDDEAVSAAARETARLGESPPIRAPKNPTRDLERKLSAVEEAQSWWAAHAAAPLLGVDEVDALRSSLSPSPPAPSPSPGQLPAEDRQRELLGLMRERLMLVHH